MANLKSAKKRIRSNERKRLRNVSVKSAIKTEIKKVEQAISEGNLEAAKAQFSEMASILDSAATKGIIKKNTASRKKSRIAKKINAILASA
ncbi:MAG: 30S ribosomal protein S20 [bacterium]